MKIWKRPKNQKQPKITKKILKKISEESRKIIADSLKTRSGIRCCSCFYCRGYKDLADAMKSHLNK